MISCRNVADVLLSDQLSAQKWWKRLEIRMHLAMCRICSRLARQLRQIGAGARQASEELPADRDFEDRMIRRFSGK